MLPFRIPMGSNFSTVFFHPCARFFLSFPLFSNPNSPNTSSSRFGDLPENCAALILSHLDPSDICNLSRINKSFQSASWGDLVWESKLPPNYDDLAARVLGSEASPKLCKREIYSGLCRNNAFDGDTKRAWLHNQTGQLCVSVSAKGLSITGIEDRRYWNYISTDESRFGQVAYMNQTWWFEAAALVELPFPAGTYSVYFRLHLGRRGRRFGMRTCNVEHVHGWDVKPVRFQVVTSGGHHVSSQSFLSETGKWKLYHAGEFVVDGSRRFTSVNISMTQIDCTHTKGGLCVDSAFVVPCTYNEWSKLF